MKNKIIITLIALVAFTFSAMAQDGATIVKLVQTPGKFEGKELKLKPGKYQFEVSNEGVAHPVAFFLQKEADKGSKDFATALKDSGLPGTLKDGESAKTGVVELAKGKYVYSCPLNPTPHYTIIVE
jgi:Cupredoxin-like domain